MKTFAAALAFVAIAQAKCQTDTQLIEQGEGLRKCEYVDTTGNRTVCYGFNLETSSARSNVEAVGGNFDDVYNGGCLSSSQCEKLLDQQVDVARQGEKQIYGNKISCQCATYVLVDMTYNLGEGGLSSFNDFNSLMESGQWDAAADDLSGTLWCSQVGSRCTRDQNQIRSCDSSATPNWSPVFDLFSDMITDVSLAKN